MKKLRILNLIFWTILAITLTVLVCKEWYYNGYGWYSLTAAIVMYTIVPGLFCWAVDMHIRERYEHN